MINEHYTPEAVILANGEYPTCPVPLTMLEEASFVACCDGAANEYISRGHTPDVIVGDGDSLSIQVLQNGYKTPHLENMTSKFL